MEANKKSLSIFSFKLILLLALLAAILIFFFLPYVPIVGEEDRYVFALNKLNAEGEREKYDLVFFGNSHAYTAYDPTMILNETGLNAIHINSSAQRLETSLAVAHEVMKKTRFKYAAFDVSDGVQHRPKIGEENIWYYQTLALQEIPTSYAKVKFATDFFPIRSYVEYYSAAVSKMAGGLFRLNQRSKYKRHKSYEKYKSPEEGILFSYNGYWASDHSPLSKKGFPVQFNKKARPKIKTDSLWKKSLKKRLEIFIKTAEGMNTEVVLINSLKLHKSNFNQDYIDSLSKKYANLRFLNLNIARDQYYLNEKSYYNSTHLNFPGSYQVTRRLCDSLLSWSGIPIKAKKSYDFNMMELKDIFYNLNDEQDKFIKLEFDSLPKALSTHKLVISLYAKDKSKLSEYSKKKGIGSDNFYVENPFANNINVGDSKIIVKRLDTRICNDDIHRMKIFFYKPKDTLKLPSFDIVGHEQD